MSEPKLKRCPFCNGKLHIMDNKIGDYLVIGKVAACEICGVLFCVPYAITEDQVVTALNRRTKCLPNTLR